MTDDLTDGQYELDGLLLGVGTAYVVRSFEDGGTPGRRVDDAPLPYDDGTAFGRDRFDGMVCSLDVLVETAGGAASWDAVNAMRRVWRGDAVRRSPGAVQVLRAKRAGAPPRRVYGRSRACTPVLSRGTGVGLVPVVADFTCADDRWYADEPVVESLAIVPASTGGIVTAPGGGIVGPITTAAATERPGQIDNPGEVDTWPVLTVRGPVTNPALELRAGGGRVWLVEFSGTLAAGQSVTLDTRPWVRTVLRENGASWSGKRTRASSPIGEVQVPPGTSTILFRGSSTSGTASAEFRFEPAYAGG